MAHTAGLSPVQAPAAAEPAGKSGSQMRAMIEGSGTDLLVDGGVVAATRSAGQAQR
ncbi:hypothetical protein ACIREE_13060 [Streptomyces sp. NPDC102467]|uniref:hypothetical protein n=1 Tax=Streptomyces sp. NPDC102467 TaxID=3366179 RepID=UPI00380F13A8